MVLITRDTALEEDVKQLPEGPWGPQHPEDK